jgi:hypothetical protein
MRREQLAQNSRMEAGCLVWTGSILKPGGYGRLGRAGLVHRMAWTLEHGPIPAGLDVLHWCDNPPCSLDEHLHLGTDADNMAEKVARGRQARGERGGRARLTNAQALEIRWRSLTESPRLLAEEFGISRSAVYKIRDGRTWRIPSE